MKMIAFEFLAVLLVGVTLAVILQGMGRLQGLIDKLLGKDTNEK